MVLQVTPSISSGLQRLSKLQSINLDCSHVTTNGLKSIGSCCTSLKELSLSKCSGVTDEGLSFISSKNKGLVKLDITCCREITDVGIATMTSSCTSLTSLRMESCSLVTSLGLRLIGQRCHLLEELDLTDNDLDDEGIFPDITLSFVQYGIKFSCSLDHSFAGLKSISGCHKLSSLKAGICLKISDEGLVHIGNSCPELQELDLYRFVAFWHALSFPL